MRFQFKVVLEYFFCFFVSVSLSFGTKLFELKFMVADHSCIWKFMHLETHFSAISFLNTFATHFGVHWLILYPTVTVQGRETGGRCNLQSRGALK